MKVSELIERLQGMMVEVGDVPVELLESGEDKTCVTVTTWLRRTDDEYGETVVGLANFPVGVQE